MLPYEVDEFASDLADALEGLRGLTKPQRLELGRFFREIAEAQAEFDLAASQMFHAVANHVEAPARPGEAPVRH